MQALPAVPGKLAVPVRAGLSRLRLPRRPTEASDDQQPPETTD
jgi:hypothetical protein